MEPSEDAAQTAGRDEADRRQVIELVIHHRFDGRVLSGELKREIAEAVLNIMARHGLLERPLGDRARSGEEF